MDLLSMEQIADKIYRSYLLVFFILSYGFLQKLVKKKNDFTWFKRILKLLESQKIAPIIWLYMNMYVCLDLKVSHMLSSRDIPAP